MTEKNELTLANWLNGQTAVERSVEVLQDGALSARWDSWVRRYERAAADDAGKGAELLVGEQSKTQALLAEGEELLARMDAARTTWFVRGIGTEDSIAIADAHPFPVNPVPLFDQETPKLRPNATDAQSQAFRAASEDYWKARNEHDEIHAIEREKYAHAVSLAAIARGYEKIARAFVRAEQGGQTVIDSLTAEDAKKLNQALGDVEFQKIIHAIELASRESTPIPGDADFLLITSGKTQD